MIKRIFIYGYVTGVFFRFFIRQNAKRLGIKGFVKNMSGHVEAVFEGSSKEVEELIKLCHRGPPAARVKDVKVKEISDYLIIQHS